MWLPWADADSILAPGRAECNSAAAATCATRGRRWAGASMHGIEDARRRTGDRSHSSNARSTSMANPQKNPGTAAVLSLIVPGDRAVLQRRLPARHLLAHRDAGLLDWHRRPVRVGVPRHRGHDGAPSRPASRTGRSPDPAAANTGHRSPGQDTGDRAADRSPRHALNFRAFAGAQPGHTTCSVCVMV